jgi:hypothetical protein
LEFLVVNDVELLRKKKLFQVMLKKWPTLMKTFYSTKTMRTGSMMSSSLLVQEVEENDVDLEVSPPPSLKKIKETWNQLKTLIIRRSSERLLSTVADFCLLLREEIHENRPTLTQTPSHPTSKTGLRPPVMLKPLSNKKQI